MLSLPIGLLLGAGAWLVVQGIKNSNRNRLIVGGVVMAMTVIFGVMQLGGELPGSESLGLERRSWLPLAIRVGMMIAVATVVVILGQLLFGSLQNRVVRGVAIIAAALVATWWLSQNWSELHIIIDRILAAITETISAK